MRTRIARWGVAVAAVVTVLGAAPAVADSTVTVRGTQFPDAWDATLSFVGCSGIYARHDEPVQPYISRGPGTAPAGERSLKYDLGGGNAIGSLHHVGSMAATDVASLAVLAPQGARGVAYAGYQAPADVGTARVWFGRATLTATAGGWQRVDATDLSYSWTQYDTRRQRVLRQARVAPTTVADFMADHGGDGPGLYTLGFGCDGAPFYLDALQIGTLGSTTTYDLEGLDTLTTIGGSRRAVTAGEAVRILGSVRSGGGEVIDGATLILEKREYGSRRWEPVDVAAADGSGASVEVDPLTRTLYRWRFADRPVAEGSVSEPFTIEVAPRLTAALEPGSGAGSAVVGSLLPARAGVVATLWQSTSSGPRVVARTRTDAQGRFRFDAAATGPGRYVVTVPAVAGNLSGTSPTVAVSAETPPSQEPSSAPSTPTAPSSQTTTAPSDPASDPPSDPPSATPSAAVPSSPSGSPSDPVSTGVSTGASAGPSGPSTGPSDAPGSATGSGTATSAPSSATPSG